MAIKIKRGMTVESAPYIKLFEIIIVFKHLLFQIVL